MTNLTSKKYKLKIKENGPIIFEAIIGIMLFLLAHLLSNINIYTKQYFIVFLITSSLGIIYIMVFAFYFLKYLTMKKY
jgi:ABC-type enterobactin transport system permease subunit